MFKKKEKNLRRCDRCGKVIGDSYVLGEWNRGHVGIYCNEECSWFIWETRIGNKLKKEPRKIIKMED